MTYTRKCYQIAGLAILMLPAGIYARNYGADFSKKTPIDDAYVQQYTQEQLSKPEYQHALMVVKDAEMKITAERRTPYRDELREQTKTIGRVMTVISPVLKRTEAIGGAVVIFDITGSGRAVNVSIAFSNPHPELGRDLAIAIQSTLFEPMIDGTIGITRVGYAMGIVWEIQDGKKRKCNVLPDPPHINEVIRMCSTMSESIR